MIRLITHNDLPRSQGDKFRGYLFDTKEGGTAIVPAAAVQLLPPPPPKPAVPPAAKEQWSPSLSVGFANTSSDNILGSAAIPIIKMWNALSVATITGVRKTLFSLEK